MQIDKIKINPQYEINKRQVDSLLEPKTEKLNDENKDSIIRPFLPVSICDNLIYNNVYLSSCITTLAEDTIYNEIKIGDNDENTDEIKEFWENNQEELCKQLIDYYSYGFGASEIICKDGKPFKLYEIQADTLEIIVETHPPTNENPSGKSYYAVQKIAGMKDIKMRLSHLKYDESDNDLPICFWLGGGRKSNFFDYPCWLSAFNHVSASVNLTLLDNKKINDGNLVSGILVIKRPPTPQGFEEDLDDTLEEKMKSKGNGIFTLELNTLNPNIPLEVEYIQISESNYDYLRELADKSDAKILSVFKIPKARLLIDDTTESMNSNKTNTLYKIYSIELNKRQKPLENNIKAFNTVYFDFDGDVEIDTPVFVDDKDIEAQITINLFDKGLITFGQAIRKIAKIFPEYNDLQIDLKNPLYNERFYNGQPFGNSEIDENPINEIGDLIDYFKIN